MPMVQRKLGPALKGTFVEHGLGGGQPGSPPVYVAVRGDVSARDHVEVGGLTWIT